MEPPGLCTCCYYLTSSCLISALWIAAKVNVYDLAGVEGNGHHVSAAVKSEASSDDDVIEVTGASASDRSGVGREPTCSSAGEQGIADGACMSCPICQTIWPANSISNAELNSHVDACLLSRVG